MVLYYYAKYGEDHGWHAGCRLKSVMFFVRLPVCPLSVCLFVTLWSYKVCDNGNTMRHCYFQNNYGHCLQEGLYLCTYIQPFYVDPPDFSLRGKFIQKKLPFSAILGAVRPHFKSDSHT